MSRLLYNICRRSCESWCLRKTRSWTDEANKSLPRCGWLIGGSWICQQSRGFKTHPNKFGFHSLNAKRSKVWLWGLGAGLVLALGLKEDADLAWGSEHKRKTPDDEEKNKAKKYASAIEISRDLLQRIKDEVAAPGIVVGVSVDGTQVWAEGLGYADLENRVRCRPETVMRIASISKPLTTATVARLWEQGRLDLDAPVQKYVPEFPEKEFKGEAVAITTRMLLSHLSGIRHYEKDAKKVKEEKEKANRALKQQRAAAAEDKALGSQEVHPKDRKNGGREPSSRGNDSTKSTKDAKQAAKKEFEQEEYYLKEKFDSVIQALDLFKNDPLIFKPGSSFLYSTHAFTLLSAVVERAAGRPFLDHMMKMFRELGMLNTVPEENDRIIYNRSRFYHFNKKGRIVNCPYVDNSYKWAGGGFLSTVGDLLVFGNAMLYSYQMAHVKDGRGLLPGYLKPETAKAMWTPVDGTEGSWDKDGQYAMGWLVVEEQQQFGQCRKRRHYVSHTGGAVGASSVLLVLPFNLAQSEGQTLAPPQGIVVTIISNMQSAGLNSTALKIALQFEKARNA
ncbi:serine beta-lactamase-like protein LACTB, mitochondrial isoform X2 [Lepisosteus oculatus]|uniref:serine beta-lactamase-like protein LACTB, mitochondrial isoform X2 n=1 Tax=Lepisosteus oculatus TaxID=7918 RepID=UPI00371F5AF3